MRVKAVGCLLPIFLHLRLQLDISVQLHVQDILFPSKLTSVFIEQEAGQGPQMFWTLQREKYVPQQKTEPLFSRCLTSSVVLDQPNWLKGKVTPLQARLWPREGQRYSSTLTRPRRQKGVSGQQHAPAIFYPRERTRTHCTGNWVGPRAGLDRRKISPPPGFDPRTAQHVAQSLKLLSYPAHSLTDTPKFLLQLFHTQSPNRLTCLTTLCVICGFVLKLSGKKKTHFAMAHFKQESVPYF